MIVAIGKTNELQQLLQLLKQLGTQVNALQTAIAALQSDVTALSAAVTAAQANEFTAADVANVTAIDTQVKSLIASLTPAPTPSS